MLPLFGLNWKGEELTLGREAVEAHFRQYFEPSATSAATTGPSASQLTDTEAPLPPGVLTDNLGIGLIIVCTKVGLEDRYRRDQSIDGFRVLATRRTRSTRSSATKTSRKSSLTTFSKLFVPSR